MGAVITRRAIRRTYVNIVERERDAVRSALRSGSRPVSLCRYYTGGPLVLTVETPESWRSLEVFRDRATINCMIPPGREAETLAWFERETGEVLP